MTKKSLDNQTSGGLQGGERDEPELKDTIPQQCSEVSQNMLLVLTVIGVYLLYLCTFLRMLVKLEYAVKFLKYIIWVSLCVTLVEYFREILDILSVL